MNCRDMRQCVLLLFLCGAYAFDAAADELRSADGSAPSPSDDDDKIPDDVFENWDEPIDEADMYESEVVGYRIRATDETSGFAETIELDEAQKTVTELSRVLSNSVGVQTRTTGGMGAYSTASVRGSTPNQVPVFLDGIQLNVGGFSVVNLGDFSLDTLKSVEIYRGNAPLCLGTSGIGGAIVLKTKTFESPVVAYAGSFGSWNTWRLFTLYGARIGKTDVLVVVSGRHSDGDFRYFNRKGTFNNPDDDEFVNRTNNDHTAYSALIKLSRDAGDWRIRGMEDFFFKNQGVTGIDHAVGVSSAELDTLRNALSLLGERSFGDKASLRLDLGHLFMFEHFNDMDGTVGVGHQDHEYQTHGVSAAALLDILFSKKHKTSFRLSERYERFDEKRLNRSPEYQQRPAWRLKTELGAEYEWTPVARLHVTPTLRGEVHYSFFGGGRSPNLLTDLEKTSKTDTFFSPSLGVRYEVVEGLTIRSNGGRYARTPDLSELFGDRGAVIGNPDLKAETGWNADAGATYILTGKSFIDVLRIDAAWFASWVSDLIAYKQNSQSTSMPFNLNAAMIQGAEVSLRLSMLDLVTLTGNYTYFYGVNRSDDDNYRGKMLPGRPRHEAYGRLDLQKKFTYVGVGGFFDADFASKSYVGAYNNKDMVTMHFFLGAGAGLELIKAGLTFTFEVKNLRDTLIFKNDEGDWLAMSDYNRYPLPGRSFFGTVHWQLP